MQKAAQAGKGSKKAQGVISELHLVKMQFGLGPLKLHRLAKAVKKSSRCVVLNYTG